MPPVHAVLGAGPLGRATAQALASRGVETRLLHRSGTRPLPATPGSSPVSSLRSSPVSPAASSVSLPPRAQPSPKHRSTDPIDVGTEAIDLLDTRALVAALAAVEVAYLCAQPAYHRWPRDFPPLLRSVMRACEANGTALVMADNLYAYGVTAHSRPLVETAADDAATRKGRVRAAMARVLSAAHAGGRLRMAIVRGSDFFGPGVRASALGQTVFAPLLQGRAVRVAGNIDAPHAYTYVGDFGEALATLGVGGNGWGEVWHVPNSAARSTRDVIECAAALAGLPPPRIAASGVIGLALAGLFIPAARETIELLPHFQHPYLVDDRKWRARMPGVETPMERALQHTLAWYAGELQMQLPLAVQ